jgi:outer membrane receptor protein involved in Fe transport
MRKLPGLLGTTALFTALFGQAFAQTPQGQAPQAAPEKAAETIIVTGTRIKAASDSGAVAVTTISRDQIEALGQASTGELMENLAQAGSFEINGAADGPNDARGDIATVNLRGLGTGNTLILLNGRRIAAHAVNQDIGSTPRQVTNVNAFPSAGIDRIEVLRDGASALYGSDATAGVVNTLLTTDFDETRVSFRTSKLGTADHGEFSADIAHGFGFNGDKTRVLAIGSWYHRDPLYSSQLGGQFQSVDKRAFLGSSPYATANTDFRNTSSASPFGEFVAGAFNADGTQFLSRRVRRGTTNLTNTGGVFHIQPCGFAGTLQEFGNRGGQGCVGLDDSTLDIGLRYDFNALQPNNARNEGVNLVLNSEQALGRQLLTEIDRVNLYGLVKHDFSDTMEGFAEALYYTAETAGSRATQPMDSGLAFLIVPKTNFWNPFGAVGSPNRIAGLNTTDVPTAGLDVLIQQWRPIELGLRNIATETTTWRALAGLKGNWNDWDWEGAFGYSSNKTTDSENNRISKTLLQAELARSTADAINPFGGANANTSAQWDRVRITSINVGETVLATGDFRVSTDELFKGWAGPIGAAFGAEWRYEKYVEDRDPRLDGTIIFNNANVSGRSDVVGVSPTNDSTGKRNVYSAFGEMFIPLLEGEGLFPNSLTLQLAARGEYFDDLEDGAIKPKVALSWFPISWLNVRGAWSQGFRVPNLVQLNRGDISRLNLGVDDFWRAPVTLDAQSNGDAYVASVRQANPGLKNEDTETVVLGTIADLKKAFGQSWIRDFRISLDYWSFKQTDVVGAFGDQEALALDFLLRRTGSSNPNVVRAAVTDADRAAYAAWNARNPNDQRQAAGLVQFVVDPYINLDSQDADGFDLGVNFTMRPKGGFGTLDFDLDVTYLNSLNVVRNDLLAALANDPSFAGVFSELQTDRIRLDGNPQWRTNLSVTWTNGPVALGVSARQISDFLDTGADPDLNGDGVLDFWTVESATRINAYGELRLGGEGRPYRVRLGVNNLTDELPPLVDDSLGYSPEFHWLKGREIFLQVRATF